MLIPIENEDLERQHKKERDRRVADRIKAVSLHSDGGDRNLGLSVVPKDYKNKPQLQKFYDGMHACICAQEYRSDSDWPTLARLATLGGLKTKS